MIRFSGKPGHCLALAEHARSWDSRGFRARPRAGQEGPGPDSPRPLPVLWAAPSSPLPLPRRRRSCCVTFALPRLQPPRARTPPASSLCAPAPSLGDNLPAAQTRRRRRRSRATRPAPGSGAGSRALTGRAGQPLPPTVYRTKNGKGLRRAHWSSPGSARQRRGARGRAATESLGARVNPSASGGWGRQHARTRSPPGQTCARHRRVRGHWGRGGRHGGSPAPPRVRNSLADSAHTQLQGLPGRIAARPPVQVTRARARARTHTHD